MRSVSAAQLQLQNVALRSRAEIVPASTPITASVTTVVHDPGQSLSVAIGSGRRAVVLGVCCSALFMVGLDNTIVNVGLPEIGKSLHTSVAGLQWTVAGYTIVLASLLLFSGAAADRIGRRTIFQVGLSLFTLGSWLCSLAPSLSWLIAFRVLQGVGGSMLNPAALGIITNTFITPSDRAKAIGVWDGVSGLSMALGPVIGGILVGTVGWRGIFWANIPVGLVAVSMTAGVAFAIVALLHLRGVESGQDHDRAAVRDRPEDRGDAAGDMRQRQHVDPDAAVFEAAALGAEVRGVDHREVVQLGALREAGRPRRVLQQDGRPGVQ